MAQPTLNIPADLQDYIEQEIIPRYVHFDKAHCTNHVRTVIRESQHLAITCQADPRMTYVVAAYHDLGLCASREHHHLVSGEILMADERLRTWFTDTQRLLMKEAVEDHRASNRQPPRNLYGLIVAEADRLIDPDTTLRRTVQYGLSHYPELNHEEQYLRFRSHLRNKYSEGGYLQLWIPQSPNAERLAKLRRLLANEEKLQLAFDRIYQEENQPLKEQ